MYKNSNINTIKSLLSQHNVIMILEHIGYKVKHSKFKLRADERTASTSVAPNGYINDFGGDFRGDIIDLLETYHNMSFRESVDYVAICLGVKS